MKIIVISLGFIFAALLALLVVYYLDFYDPKYPVKLTLIWCLMFLGIRTDGMSAEAHRIYNERRCECV